MNERYIIILILYSFCGTVYTVYTDVYNVYSVIVEVCQKRARVATRVVTSGKVQYLKDVMYRILG